jgi:uncharacterized protein
MAALCDVNGLLALCYDRHMHHPHAKTWLETQDAWSVVLCRMTQLNLLRLLTNPGVMGPDVCSLEQAWTLYDTLVGDERFYFTPEPNAVEQHLRRYTVGGRVSPKLWQDAYLAAFARTAQFHLVTFDRGFLHYEGLRVILLGA